MYKSYKILLFCFLFSAKLKAQNLAMLEQPFGKVDPADLQMTLCDFEKDANAEVLFKFGSIYYGDDLKSITMVVHKRIKIFNNNANSLANIHIPYFSENRLENITAVEAETINLADGKPQITKLDRKSVHTTIIDNETSEVSFAMPDVKPGCIIDYKYKWTGRYNSAIPSWYFQEEIPVKYNQLDVAIPDIFYFRPQLHINLPLAKNASSVVARTLKVATHTFNITDLGATGDQQTATFPYIENDENWGMANIPSLHNDAFTSSFADNVQRLTLDLVSIKPIGGFSNDYSDTWAKVGGELAESSGFGSQLNPSLNGADSIIANAALLKSPEDKIAYIFNQVKNKMKWNEVNKWYTSDGTRKAWDNGSGNSTEINLILYHLLKQSKIEAYPMVVSTRINGRPDPWRTSLEQFDKTVVYVPIDDARNLILDASGKYNIYNEIPAELLNSFGLYIDKSKNTYDTLTIKKDAPVRQVILINGEVKPDGKLIGTAQINSVSYDRMNSVKEYKTDGEEKYIELLRNGDNNLKISAIKFVNIEVDTLPLTQNIDFKLESASTDQNYIYINTNLFTPLNNNPFLSENRLTDIYFGYLRTYSINSIFKLPPGYTTDALPKSVNIVMGDKSISFKRIVGEQDGSVTIHYVIDFRKKAYNVQEYPAIHDFYKKMYEMLNEQIVLKKAG